MTDSVSDNRGARDAAAILPFLGLVLFFPPLVYIFTAPLTVAGIPLIVVYIFGVWAAMILATFLVARRLKPDPEDAPPVSGSAERH